MTGGKIFKNTENKTPKAALVSVRLKDQDEKEADASLLELEKLLETAGGECAAKVIQTKDSFDSRTVMGSGKLKELSEICKANEIDLVIFDTELSPSQIKNIEDELDNVQVIDRTMLILDIFALHARTGEGKLQVELAQLKYTAPRLVGKGLELSRLGGGIGTRGPGESKLETDRRHLKRRMETLREELRQLEKNRETMRKQRERSQIMNIAIVGYTNAGKSTLLNYLTNAGILAEDKLFATLDPTTRKYTLPDGTDILLTDTVGFIRNLPHHLVEAFKSTLDEAVFADAIIIMIDASDEEREAQLEVTEKILNELGAGDKPVIYVLNKCDKVDIDILSSPEILRTDNTYAISLKTGQGVDRLIEALQKLAREGKSEVVFNIPHAEQGVINTIYKNAVVNSVEYGDEYVTVSAVADAKLKGMLRKYIAEK